MKLQGIVTKITKKTVGIKVVFSLALDEASAKAFNKASLECVYFGSKLNLYAPVSLEGEMKNGYFDVTGMSLSYTDTSDVSKFMAHKVKGCGLGLKRIEAICAQFGGKVLSMDAPRFKEVLENDYEGRISAKEISDFLYAWFYAPTISEIEEFFASYEVKLSAIEKVDEEYGKEAVSKIKENPYEECIKFDIKRPVAERIAKDTGILPLDKRRIFGLIEYALLSAESEGHTFISAPELLERVNKVAVYPPFRTKVPAVLLANEVTTNRAFYLDRKTGCVSLLRTHNDEINCALRLRQIKNGFKSYITVSDTDIKQVETMLNFHFSDHQKEAFKALESGGVNILTGGPGTGKTTIARGIIEYFKMKNPGGEVLLCAPTGRAAKRLSESTGMDAKTIHKTLEYNPFMQRESKYSVNNPLPVDFVLIDEVSMCDVHILSLLLDAIPEDCRVLFIGDEDQLPSVGAGNCLHDMIASELFNVYRLTENFRSEGSIVENANQVMRGLMPKEESDFEIKRVSSEKEGHKVLSELMELYYKPDDPFYCQMIEASKKGAAGCLAMNAEVHKAVHASLGKNVSEELMVGDKIMFIRNEYINGETEPLYTNGEVVQIVALTDSEVVIFDGEGERTLNRSALSDARLCYSYTIHKSQGSENDVVIIYLSGTENVKRMMNRNLLYTAITRAKKKVIIVYSEDALESCIKNEYAVKRNTKLKEQLLAFA